MLSPFYLDVDSNLLKLLCKTIDNRVYKIPTIINVVNLDTFCGNISLGVILTAINAADAMFVVIV